MLRPTLFCLLVGACVIPAPAQPSHRMYVTGATSKGYVAGAKLLPSGLWTRDGDQFRQMGFNHPQVIAVAADPRDPRVLYLAAGNGCLRSPDGGRTWRIITGWDMTELKDVVVDPARPDDLYVALPDGIGVSHDAGKTWARIHDRYTQALAIDRTRAGRVVAGTATGIVVFDNGTRTTLDAMQKLVVTDVEQSPGDPLVWMAATQQHGIWESRDGAHTWSALHPMTQTLQNIAFGKGNLRAASSWGAGVLVSTDDGRSWTPRNEGLPSKNIWRVSYDPDRPSRLWASVHEDALWQSDDAGKTWTRDGIEGSTISSITFLPERAMDARVREIVAQIASAPGASLSRIAARLWQQQAGESDSRELIELLKDPVGDMFWMFPTTAIAYLDNGQLTMEARAALRHSWRTYMPFRGDTENHWLLYYTSLYLMAQRWPHEPGEMWFTGKSSAENLREADEYLRQWTDLTVTKGQGEYDCTHYIGVYLLPLSYLAEWAEDPAMRQRARMMLDYVIADYAVENLNGLYAGAHARTDDVQVLEKWNGVSSDFGWLLFGLGYRTPSPGYSFWYSLASAYEPPEVIQRIARDRSTPYLHKELKRTRHRWRMAETRNGPVYKTTYMRREYAVGSDQGGVLQPIQQHSWDVTWAVPDPRGVHNTLFATHPYSSPDELQTYFGGQRDFITEAVTRSKKSYDSPDKFLGGSPYEQVFQDLDTVVALYNIPAGTRFPHIHAFFSKDLRQVTEDPSGWIFARGGDTYLAVYPLAPYRWEPMTNGDRRLVSPHLQNGIIVQAAAVSEFADLAAFSKAIRALPLKTSREPRPTVSFRTLRGNQIECAYQETPTVNGTAVRYQDWKLFEGPFLNAEPGSRRLTLTHGTLRRELDFSNLTIKEN